MNYTEPGSPAHEICAQIGSLDLVGDQGLSVRWPEGQLGGPCWHPPWQAWHHLLAGPNPCCPHQSPPSAGWPTKLPGGPTGTHLGWPGACRLEASPALSICPLWSVHMIATSHSACHFTVGSICMLDFYYMGYVFTKFKIKWGLCLFTPLNNKTRLAGGCGSLR